MALTVTGRDSSDASNWSTFGELLGVGMPECVRHHLGSDHTDLYDGESLSDVTPAIAAACRPKRRCTPPQHRETATRTS
jgi:hypothetical protein